MIVVNINSTKEEVDIAVEALKSGSTEVLIEDIDSIIDGEADVPLAAVLDFLDGEDDDEFIKSFQVRRRAKE